MLKPSTEIFVGRGALCSLPCRFICYIFYKWDTNAFKWLDNSFVTMSRMVRIKCIWSSLIRLSPIFLSQNDGNQFWLIKDTFPDFLRVFQNCLLAHLGPKLKSKIFIFKVLLFWFLNQIFFHLFMQSKLPTL